MNFNNKLPEWKNSGTEPSDSLKNDGFKAGYKPSANVFNWFWSLVSKCITEIQSKLSNEETARTEADKNLQQPTFTEASTRVNITSGETLSTLFGKIKKFFTDLKTVAFTGSYILILRYLNFQTWEMIACKMNYSYVHIVHNLHPKALRAIEKVLKENGRD